MCTDEKQSITQYKELKMITLMAIDEFHEGRPIFILDNNLYK